MPLTALPTTGNASLPLVLAGMGAVLGGAGLIILTKRNGQVAV
jgi:LPXTG-motif cell wall-anchored protein